MALLVGLLAMPAAAGAAVTGFTDRATFDAAIAGYQDLQVLDFDAVPAGTTIPNGGALDGVRFAYSIDGFELRVIDVFGTTSGANSLGLDADDALLSGDTFTMGFDRTIHAVGVYAIGEDLLAGDFELRLPGGAFVANGAVPDVVLTDGVAFFLGLVESDPEAGFTSVELASIQPAAGDFSWNADDVVSAVAVPEPAGGATLAMAVLSGLARRLRPRAR